MARAGGADAAATAAGMSMGAATPAIAIASVTSETTVVHSKDASHASKPNRRVRTPASRSVRS